MSLPAAVPAMDAQSPVMRLIAPAKIKAGLVGHLRPRNLPEGLEGPVLESPSHPGLVRQAVDAPLLKVCPPFGALPGGQYVGAIAVVDADAYTFRSLLPNPCAVLAFLPLPDGVEDICR